MEGKGKAELGDVVIGGSLMHAGAAVVEATETEVKPDFSGWASKYDLKCSDGRTILKDAFKHQDGVQLPLVWQHTHDDIENVLGHVVIEHRDEGPYCYGYFNETPKGQNAKTLVAHKDLNYLSIFANSLVEKAKQVSHGVIREVSLVLAGANAGAMIDALAVQHSDGTVVDLEDEAIIYTGLELEHEDKGEGSNDGPTVQEVLDSMNDEQTAVMHYMVGQALEEAKATPGTPATPAAAEHSALPPKDAPNPNREEGLRMSRNVFEQQQDKPGSGTLKHTVSDADKRTIAHDAMMMGSAKKAFEAYALKHGIENIDILFPDAKAISDTPEFDSRRMEWVKSVLNGTVHRPFSRIKSLFADITHDEARAKGYIKGTFKKEEWFALAKRTTTPTTVYKKQKLDRNDIIDITDLDVVAWLKAEMRMMLEEEIGRAILIGDGRDIGDEDKILDPAGASSGEGVRSILHDDDLYAATINVNIDDANSNPQEIVEAIMLGMQFYKGSGSPTLFTTLPMLTKMLLAKDGMGRRLWRTASDLASEMGVASIQTVEVMEEEADLVGIIVNLRDYSTGTDRGGDITMFDDFDIDYNQYKYLIETRLSGALTKIRSALIVKKTASNAVAVVPGEPAFNTTTGVVTIPTQTGVVYKNQAGTTLTAGAQTAVAAGAHALVFATPASGYFFANNVDDEWQFTRDPA